MAIVPYNGVTIKVSFAPISEQGEDTNLWNKYDAYMGNRIRAIRQEKKLTQEMLSAQLQVYGCDISRSVLAKIEVGQRHLYPWEIKAFKEILKVSYDDLFV